jgi:PAS domain S-box-containing protein
MMNAASQACASWPDIVGYGLVYGLLVALSTAYFVARRERATGRHYRTLFHSTPVGIVNSTVDGGVVFCNEAFCAITGYSADDFISGRIRWSDITPPEWLPIDAKAMADAKLLGACKPYEKEYIRSDGTRVPVLIGFSLFGRGDNQAACFVMDLSEIRSARQRAESNDSLYRAFFELTSVGIAQIDAITGQFVCVNNKFCQMLGYTEAELLTKTTFEVSHPCEVQLNRDQLREARLHTGAHIDLEKRYRRKDGSYFWAQLTANMVWDADGKPSHTIGVIIDISDRVRLQQMLQQSNQKKDAFLAVLAHELRNPLAPIRTALDILRDDTPQSTVAQQMHGMMLRQVGHMVHLIDDLLDMSRITQGKIALRKRDVSIKKIVEDALDTVQPVLRDTGHSIEVSIPQQDLVIRGDDTRLIQVVSNLLSNAAKYTPTAGTISIVVNRVEDRCVISVRDTGIGIPEASLSSIFEMYTQVDQNMGVARGGLGIGLFLVKKLVELHGGTVTAASSGPSQGSSFTVELPLDCTEIRYRDTTQAKRLESPFQRRILVVDDNRDAADSLAMLLECEGHIITCAYTGFQALERSEEFHPDTVLLDIGLPDTDGYAVAQKLRNSDIGPQLSIIALTGWGSEEDKARAREAGFDAHLTKPVEVEVLASLLNQLPSHPPH